jgi:hypothetical protein
MESIVHFVEGDKPNSNTTCFFCKERARFVFGIINNNKTIISDNKEAFIMTSVGLCSSHAEAFNSLLSENSIIQLLYYKIKNIFDLWCFYIFNNYSYKLKRLINR